MMPTKGDSRGNRQKYPQPPRGSEALTAPGLAAILAQGAGRTVRQCGHCSQWRRHKDGNHQFWYCEGKLRMLWAAWHGAVPAEWWNWSTVWFGEWAVDKAKLQGYGADGH